MCTIPLQFKGSNSNVLDHIFSGFLLAYCHVFRARRNATLEARRERCALMRFGVCDQEIWLLYYLEFIYISFFIFRIIYFP